MQKLYWQNAKGQTIDLTAEPYGITDWEGFSNTELNVQTQQVPFNDGGVYLDALMEQRELSVTLAIKDKNILEDRYRLRRELIAVLNPKLGEGYLIYENDFLQKRIKCVPYIPQFENHNSNTKGTPKASLTWLACEPYWEDVEETRVVLQAGISTVIENNGDVPCAVTVDVMPHEASGIEIVNNTQGKKIKITGEQNDLINISTETGKKEINKVETTLGAIYPQNYAMDRIYYHEASGNFLTVYSTSDISVKDSAQSKDTLFWDKLNRYYIGVANNIIFAYDDGALYISYDAITYTKVYEPNIVSLEITSVAYLNGVYIAVGNNGGTKYIFKSTDGKNWTNLNLGYGGVDVVTGNDMFIIAESDGSVYKSTDGTNWTHYSTGASSSTQIEFCKDKFYLSGFESTDGENWTTYTGGGGYRNFVYSSALGVYINTGLYHSYYSTDGSTWTQTDGVGFDDCVYSADKGLFVGIVYSGSHHIYTSTDGIHWKANAEYSVYSIVYCEEKDVYIFSTVYSGSKSYIYITNDFVTSTKVYETADMNVKVTYSKNLKMFFAGSDEGTIFSSTDGLTWEEYASGKTYTQNIVCGENEVLVIGTDYILRTLNGSTWTEYEYNYGGVNSAYSDTLKRYATVNSDGTICYSADGITWNVATQDRTGTAGELILWNGALKEFFVIGVTGVSRSTDGINWKFYNSYQQEVIFTIAYSFALGLYVAGGYGEYIATSTDGINWTQLYLGATDITASCVMKNGNVFVGGYTVGKIEDINIIDAITSDSDMSLGLDTGSNTMIATMTGGTLTAKISYRQKYIGV